MDVYDTNGKVEKSMELPAVFHGEFREEIIRRALLAEQSRRYQPQGHDVMAGLRTTAVYVGNYKSYRTGRHMGIAIRPRQRLGGGAQGDVRRIPSATKGRRAHPHKIEKVVVENINRKEYLLAIKSAIAGCTKQDILKSKRMYEGKPLPLIIDNKIENVANTKELLTILNSLGLSSDLERSHKPHLKKGLKRSSKNRSFRKSVLIVVDNMEKVGKAGRNIPGVDVVSIKKLSIGKLAPGALPRISIWSENAAKEVEKAIEK
jgi:large subunit ribosomal protein L4e